MQIKKLFLAFFSEARNFNPKIETFAKSLQKNPIQTAQAS